MTTIAEKRKGKWQNLARAQCPYDSGRLFRDGKVLACEKCDFYITPQKMFRFLTDRTSATWLNMSEEDRKKVEEGVGQILAV